MTPPVQESIDSPKIGTLKGGFLLARASWSTLKLSKDILKIQLFAVAFGFGVTCVLGLLIWVAVGFNAQVLMNSFVAYEWLWAIVAGLYFLAGLIVSNIFTATIVRLVLALFNGEKITITDALVAVRGRSYAIMQYSFLQTIVTVLYQLINHYIDMSHFPLVGKIFARLATFLADLSFQVATVFALPVLMSSEKSIGPLDMIKGSAGLVKKVWGQGLVGGLGLGVIIILSMIPILIFSMITGILAASQGPQTLLVTLPILVVWLVVTFVITDTLNLIFHAALFHFATTNESPIYFDQKLLRAAFVPKKKWFV